jgi:polyisoprenyl-teichoic acid--peptidoglycan teichoic acid transferase
MNEFLNKHPKGDRRRAPIDGVSARPRVRFNQGSNTDGFTRGGDQSENRPSALDNFQKEDGFHSTAQRQISQQQQPATFPDPIIIERSRPKQKKRRLGFFGRKNKSALDGEGRRKPALSRKKKILRTLAIIFILLALIVGFLFAKGYINLRKVLQGGGGAAALQENVDPSKLKGEGDGRVNILLLGRGGEGHEGADLTDTIILVSVDPIAKEAALVSIPRDLYVTVSGSGSMKVNAVFATGKSAAISRYTRQNSETKKQAEEAGFKMLETTLEKTLGVPIHYHAMIDFTGFEQAVNTVGGIDVNAPSAVYEKLWIKNRNYVLDVKPGWQHMDGFKALAYSRSRYTSARGDFDRSERQRLIIVALKEKIFTLGTFGNPNKISQLIDNFGSHVQTNFSVQDLQRLYDLSKDITGNKISSIGLADPPNNYIKTANIGGASVVIPSAGVGNYKEIQSYLRNVLKDSYIKNENASVIVLNGTQKAGIATEKGDELKSFGYNVVKVDNAPTKNYSKTVIVDLRNGSKRYTRNYLEKRFGVSATGSLPDSSIQSENADFVIIIGNDQIKN